MAQKHKKLSHFCKKEIPKLYLLSTYSVVPFSLSAVDNQVTVPSVGCALISVRLWNFKEWWVLKSKIFGQESTYSKDFCFKSVDELQFTKKCRNFTFKVSFLCQKLTKCFQKKIHLRITI